MKIVEVYEISRKSIDVPMVANSMDFHMINPNQTYVDNHGLDDVSLVDCNFSIVRRKIYCLSRNVQHGPHPEQQTRYDEYFILDEDLRQSIEIIMNGSEYENSLKEQQSAYHVLNKEKDAKFREILRLNAIIDDFWAKPWYKRVWLAIKGETLN